MAHARRCGAMPELAAVASARHGLGGEASRETGAASSPNRRRRNGAMSAESEAAKKSTAGDVEKVDGFGSAT